MVLKASIGVLPDVAIAIIDDESFRFDGVASPVAIELDFLGLRHLKLSSHIEHTFRSLDQSNASFSFI